MSVGTAGYLEARLEKRQEHFFLHAALNHQEIRYNQTLIRVLQLTTFHTSSGKKSNMHLVDIAFWFTFLFACFELESYYVALAGLELVLQTKVISKLL